MPRSIANCTCRYCGKEFAKELIETGKGASKRLAEKIEWAEGGGIDECPDCRKSRQRAIEKAQGLTCAIRLGSATEHEITVYAVFGGDSFAHKDALKAAGCRWTWDYPSGNTLEDVIGFSQPRFAWVLSGSDPDELIKKAKDLGASITLPEPEELSVWGAWRLEALKVNAERQARVQTALDELGAIPAWPESIRVKWPDGATWNGKIYGKASHYSIYLSGEQISLTDEEAKAMAEIQAQRDDWRKRKAKIEAEARG